MRSERGVVLALVCALLAGCPSTPYRCDGTHACAPSSVCTAAGYCAEPVARTVCPGGLRYSSSAANPGACVAPVQDAAPDLGMDVADDVTTDAADDVTTDVSADAAPDVTPDVSVDIPTDIAPDVAPDVTPDVTPDVAPDVAPDAAPDAAPDIPIDVAPDVTPDATPDVPRDLGSDAPADVVVDAPRDVAADIGPDVTTACQPPRLIAPLSGTRLTHRQARFTWQTLTRVDAVEVQTSRTPGFTALGPGVGGGGNSATITLTPQGVWYWRVRSHCGMAVSDWSPIWSVRVANVDTTQSPVGWTQDLDGDGLDDVVIGRPLPPSAIAGEGVVDVIFGRTGSVPDRTMPMQRLMGTGFRSFGSTVAIVPDMNGDGLSELAVGSCARSNTSPCDPTVLLYSATRGDRMLNLVARIPYPGTTPGTSRFGVTLAGAGDLDGDGYGDLAIGDPGTLSSDLGLLYIVRGGPTHIGTTQTFNRGVSTTGTLLTRFAWRVAAPGDVDGDGLPDLVVTSFERAWLHRGQSGAATVLDGGNELTVSSPVDTLYGLNAAGAGDLNRDGRADFVLARPGVGSGEVSVFVSMRSDPLIYTGPEPGSRLGAAMSGGGNFIGDEGDDVIVGAPGVNTGNGAVLWITGSTVPALSGGLRGPPSGLPAFGSAVTVMGDFDGDGDEDIAASASNPTTLTSVVEFYRSDLMLTPRGLNPWSRIYVTMSAEYGQALAGR